jgi:hypothetical protein
MVPFILYNIMAVSAPFCHGCRTSSGHRGRGLPGRDSGRSPERRLRPCRCHRRPRCVGAEPTGREAGRECHSAAHEPGSEPLLTPRQPALDRSDRPAELLRGHFAGQALELTEDDRLAELPGKPVELLVQLRPGRVFARGSIVGISRSHFARPPLVRPPPGG